MSDSTRYTIQGTPIYNFLAGERVSLSAELDSIEVEEKDFVLYVLWMIDSLRDPDSRPGFLKDPWAVARSAIRKHLRDRGYAHGKEDVDYLTDIVCGYALFCWGFVLTDAAKDFQTNQGTFMTFEHNLQSYWRKVQECCNSIQCESTPELRRWMISYVNGDIFCTISDAVEWDSEVMGMTPAATRAAPGPTTIINIGHFENHPGAVFNDNSVIGAPYSPTTKQLK